MKMQQIYTRIDERLIHGQVSLRWKQVYGITRYIVVDDLCAKDSFRQKIMCTSDKTPTDFLSVQEAVIQIPKYGKDTLLVIAPSPFEILELVKKGVKIPSCNIGNMHMSVDRVQIGTSVAISLKEKQAFQEMMKAGVQLEMRPYPESESECLEILLEE